MCGIAGVVSSSPAQPESWLGDATAALRHRGPDGEETWVSDDGRVAFGHRLLAIIDLSEVANQPMLLDGGRL